MKDLRDYRDNVYSQWGEDGIIKELLNYIEPNQFAIEFGAADGLFMSNTARLWIEEGYQALLIESDAGLYAELEKRVRHLPGVETRNAYVSNIDTFTRRVADVCSIDVDGSDFQIAERMQTPHKIVVIEHNPTVPPHVSMVNIEGTAYGSSALSITELMTHKGYTLVAVTKTNCIFLHGDWTNEFVTDLDVLFDRSSLNYIVTSYDGFYDTIGEFGYGYNRPANLRLHGRDSEVSKTYDSTTQEYMRQMVALEEGKR